MDPGEHGPSLPVAGKWLSGNARLGSRCHQSTSANTTNRPRRTGSGGTCSGHEENSPTQCSASIPGSGSIMISAHGISSWSL